MSDAALTGQWPVPSSCRLMGANEGITLHSRGRELPVPPVPVDCRVQQLLSISALAALPR